MHRNTSIAVLAVTALHCEAYSAPNNQFQYL